jgi:hypothetical protein
MPAVIRCDEQSDRRTKISSSRSATVQLWGDMAPLWAIASSTKTLNPMSFHSRIENFLQNGPDTEAKRFASHRNGI